jgi:poly-gamma-glutamate synthase PgsB/CapB
MYSFYILLVVIIVAAVLGFVEYVRHQKRIYSIPIRVHINGTRGKSSVTRLIAAGLRAGGKKTLAKTTGSAASIIYENGNERLINRYFGANIKEQIKTIKFASERKVEYLVLECMAVTPEYQWETEHKMVKADIGVITNSRLDHLDVMGPGIKNVTLSLCNTIPKNGKMFTAEYKMFPLMKKIADKMGTYIERSKEETVSDEEMRKFSHIEHKENVALALAVCKACGVDRETALQGMYKAKPDVGAAEIFVKNIKIKRFSFLIPLPQMIRNLRKF